MTVIEERAEVAAAIAGKTLPMKLAETAANFPNDPAYYDKQGVESGWRQTTWQQVRETGLDVAAALVSFGVQPGEKVAIMASSRIEHVLADLGGLHSGAIPMSIYSTLSPDQVAYVCDHAQPTVLILEGSDQINRWQSALTNANQIRKIIILQADQMTDSTQVSWEDAVAIGKAYREENPTEIEQRWQNLEPNDPATILYTSGTTGNPKGVVLTHYNILFESESSMQTAELSGQGVTVSYLPFAHIAERILGMYVPQIQGGHVHLISDPAQLLAALGEVRPDRFFGVPRVWEKIKTGVSAKLAAEPDPEKKAMVESMMAIGLEYIESQQTGQQTSAELAAKFAAADQNLLSILRALLGLDRVQWAASAAAPMPIEVAKFFAGLGIKIFDVYGMTETCGSVASGGPNSFRLGTVGKPLKGVELKLGEDGEVITRSPLNSPGYYQNPKATQELIDADGWVHTGDIGEIDADGYLKIVDRKKEIIITSSGKNIAPSNIENMLKESPLVGHAMVIGEAKPYVVAILTLDGEIAPVIAQQLGIEDADLARLAEHPQIIQMISASVAAVNERLSRPEQVKKFELLPAEWTAESEELTPTLKLKRRVINTKYAPLIEKLYAE